VGHLDVFYGYGTDSGELKIEVLEGGHLTRQWSETNGRWYAAVTFPRALRKGERREIRLRFILPPDASDCPSYCTVTPAHLVTNVSIRLTFAGQPPASPWAAYWVSDVSPVRCLDRMLKVDDSGVVRYYKRRTKPGHRYGIVWDWADH
jgi:hypothetical protein